VKTGHNRKGLWSDSAKNKLLSERLKKKIKKLLTKQKQRGNIYKLSRKTDNKRTLKIED
jgi:hypothetical protein